MIAAVLSRWGLGWLLGPVGKALALGLAALVVVHLIRQDAIADCEADELRAQLALKDAQLAEQAKIIDAARTRADAAEARATELKDLTNDIILDTGSSCPIDDDLRERLRSIR